TPYATWDFSSRHRSPLDAHHLLQVRDDLDQVALLRDHLGQVLVRAGDLVHHARVLAALDPVGLPGQVVDREGPPRLAPGHPPSRAVRGRAVGQRVAQPADDVRTGAHAAGDDAQLTGAGPDRALAGHQQL